MSPEARERIATFMRSDENPNRGRKATAEAKRHQSEAHAGKGRGQDNPGWKGGKYVSASSGYVLVYVADNDDFASMRPNARPYVHEHRLVMAAHLGRPLSKSEVVHHKLPEEGGSGIRTDNRIENLSLFSSHADHMRHHKRLQSPELKHEIATRAGQASGLARRKH